MRQGIQGHSGSHGGELGRADNQGEPHLKQSHGRTTGQNVKMALYLQVESVIPIFLLPRPADGVCGA